MSTTAKKCYLKVELHISVIIPRLLVFHLFSHLVYRMFAIYPGIKLV